MATPRVVTYVRSEDRRARATERLVELTGGPDVADLVRMERLAQLRDTSKGADVTVAAEVVYLTKLRAECQSFKSVAIEAVIGGNKNDTHRRVFAHITRVAEHDGTVFDLHTKERTRRFAAIPMTIETETPTCRVQKEQDHA